MVRTHHRRLCLVLALLAAGCGGDAPEDAPRDMPRGASGTPVAGAGALEAPTADDGLPPELVGDPRIAELPRDCRQIDPYLRDTADTLAILEEKLEFGDAEVLARACEELGALGEAAVPRLARRLAAQINDPESVLLIQNTIRALGLNASDGASDALVRALAHPVSAIRTQVLAILAERQLAPRHFEALLDAAFFESGGAQTNAIVALWSADEPRAALQLLDWLAEGRTFVDAGQVGALIAACDEPAFLARLAATSVPAELAPYRDAALQRAGDADAAAATTHRLVHADLLERAATVEAALAAGLYDVLEWVVASQEAHELRSMAVLGLAGALASPDAELGARARARLVAALDDPVSQVRDAALRVLVDVREPVAIDRALAGLGGGRRELEAVLPPLHGAMLADAALARRGRERVLAELARNEGAEPARVVHLVQALALCPGAESADLVLEQADAAPEGALLEGIRAHRFLAIQAANTGPEGRARLVERLEQEEDALERLDLLWAIASQRDELTRATLAALLERDDVDPWERAYAAHLLCRTGPAAFAAPIVKAAARRLEGAPRRVVECLLWRWY
jgi:hypothetical protein